MPIVRVKHHGEHSDHEKAIRQFKRVCEKAGIITEARHREFYEKPSEIRKRQKAAAVKRWQKKLQREQESRNRRGPSASRGRK